MFGRFYLIYFGIYLTIVHSFNDVKVSNNDDNMDGVDGKQRENIIKLNRIKRADPPNTTLSAYLPGAVTSEYNFGSVLLCRT